MDSLGHQIQNITCFLPIFGYRGKAAVRAQVWVTDRQHNSLANECPCHNISLFARRSQPAEGSPRGVKERGGYQPLPYTNVYVYTTFSTQPTAQDIDR